jgi:uncharacterized protein (DUF4415 family)
MKQNDIVTYRIDLSKPLTRAQKAELKRLAAKADEPVDTSDIPEATEEFWKNAVRNPFYRPVKAQLTVRIDADVVAWLKASGRGYQTRLNEILRRAMVEELGRT